MYTPNLTILPSFIQNIGVGYSILSLISMISGLKLEEFVHAPFTFFLFLIFVIVMVVLFTNLLVSLILQ